MTALQLQRLLDRAGLSQRGAAKALEINERTIRKYVAGESKVPKTVELALLYLCGFDRRQRWLGNSKHSIAMI